MPENNTDIWWTAVILNWCVHLSKTFYFYFIVFHQMHDANSVTHSESTFLSSAVNHHFLYDSFNTNKAWSYFWFIYVQFKKKICDNMTVVMRTWSCNTPSEPPGGRFKLIMHPAGTMLLERTFFSLNWLIRNASVTWFLRTKLQRIFNQQQSWQQRRTPPPLQLNRRWTEIMRTAA